MRQLHVNTAAPFLFPDWIFYRNDRGTDNPTDSLSSLTDRSLIATVKGPSNHSTHIFTIRIRKEEIVHRTFDGTTPLVIMTASAVLILLFWGTVRWFSNIPIQEVTSIHIVGDFTVTLPFAVSRWWDAIIGPLYMLYLRWVLALAAPQHRLLRNALTKWGPMVIVLTLVFYISSSPVTYLVILGAAASAFYSLVLYALTGDWKQSVVAGIGLDSAIAFPISFVSTLAILPVVLGLLSVMTILSLGLANLIARLLRKRGYE